MALKLYGYENNPRTRIIRIVAAAQGVSLELVNVVPRSDINRDLLIDKFPRSCGKIPALDGPGVSLTEVMAIAHYVTKVAGPTTLLGDGSPGQEAEVISWMSWANQELLVTLAKWPAAYDNKSVEAGKTSSLAMLETLEAVIGDRECLVGEATTLADIFVAVVLSRGLEWVLDGKWRAQHPNCMRHFDKVRSWAPVASVIPEFVLVEKEPIISDPYI
ncbi:glutathione-S-transferase theta, GST [Colletotrichum zoysiae]|uniref:Glutathione-S-transferase theta, GST n=1 Tax=Colletotrichum zoysiae TaxID=1216348 RepID=A0AAD9HGY8_9PEZI|nr:glutathione-S-transferase theta, GST [Colletotrichum zoysiae]